MEMHDRDLLTIASIAADLDRTMIERSDRMGDALLGVLVFTRQMIDATSERAIEFGVQYPDELLLARAAMDDFLRKCGVEIKAQ